MQAQNCVHWVALGVMINKEKAALPCRNSFFHSSGLFKREGLWEAGGLNGIWLLSLHMPHCPASMGKNLLTLHWRATCVCRREWGLGGRDKKKLEGKQTRGHCFNETALSYPNCTFSLVYGMALTMVSLFLCCVVMQTWMCIHRQMLTFSSICSCCGLIF